MLNIVKIIIDCTGSNEVTDRRLEVYHFRKKKNQRYSVTDTNKINLFKKRQIYERKLQKYTILSNDRKRIRV